MYIYLHIRMYIHMYTCMYIYVYMYIYIHAYQFSYMYINQTTSEILICVGSRHRQFSVGKEPNRLKSLFPKKTPTYRAYSSLSPRHSLTVRLFISCAFTDHHLHV